MQLKGKVSFQNIGTGVWCIQGNDSLYAILNMPPQLQREGISVTVIGEPRNIETAFMIGTPFEITSFATPKSII